MKGEGEEWRAYIECQILKWRKEDGQVGCGEWRKPILAKSRERVEKIKRQKFK